MATCRDYWLPGCVPKQYAPKAASSVLGRFAVRVHAASWAWIYSIGGRVRTRLRNQMRRLFNCSVFSWSTRISTAKLNVRVSPLVADKRSEFWWNERKPDERVLWESKIELGEKFYNEIIQHPVPLDMNTLKALTRCALGPRSLPVAHLPHLRPPRSAAPHLATGVPPVRGAPRQRQAIRCTVLETSGARFCAS